MALGGVLLTGGRSSRFGEDKALVRVGGERLLDRALEALRDACDGPVVIANGDGTAVEGGEHRAVADVVAGAGPLAGIAAGLGALRGTCTAAAVLAVDHLAPSAALLRLLADARGDAECALAVVGGRPQPLHAVWRVDAADAIAAAVRAGERGVLRWLDGRAVVRLGEEQLRRAGVDPGATRDVDEPGDLPRA